MCPWAHFANDCSIVIQIRWKIGFSVTPLMCITSLKKLHMPQQHSCHAMCKFHTDHIIKSQVRAEWNFHGSWIQMEKNHSWNWSHAMTLSWCTITLWVMIVVYQIIIPSLFKCCFVFCYPSIKSETIFYVLGGLHDTFCIRIYCVMHILLSYLTT